MHSGGMNHQTFLLIQRHLHPVEGGVPFTALHTVQSAQGYVRQGLCHAIGTPYIVGHIFQGISQLVADSPTSYDEVTNLSQSLRCLLHEVPHLHRYHRGKINGTFPLRTPFRLCADQSQSAGQGSHHHHFSCDIVERHTEQSCVALLQSQKIAGDTCRSLHASFLHLHRFRLARRTAGMHPDGITVILPFV